MKEKKIIFVKTVERHEKNKHRRNGVFLLERTGGIDMTANRMAKIYTENGGCNEDCLNCKYPDCYKPMKAIIKTINSKRKGEGDAKCPIKN